MGQPRTIDELSRFLRHRHQLLAAGYSDGSIRTAIKRAELRRLARGWFVEAPQWTRLAEPERHLLRALCAHMSASKPPIFSHVTAAAILGLPLLRFEGLRVHTLVPAGSKFGSSGNVLRHRASHTETEVCRSGGLQHTSLMRTVIDVASMTPFENGVVVGDAAVRRLVRGGAVPLERARASLLERLGELPASRGRRRAQRVIRFLHDSAESPLESLFRLQLNRLGFEVRPQVPVIGPRGESYRIDFELVGHATFFEADGKVKYLEERYRRGRTLEQLLLDEKYREDWVRGSEDKRVIRAGWNEALDAEVMAVRLRAFGVIPPVDLGHQRRLDLY